MNVELTVRAVGTTSPGGVEVETQTREEFLVFFFTELSKSNNLEGDCGNGRRRSCAPGDERREERARVTREEGSDDGVGKERLRDFVMSLSYFSHVPEVHFLCLRADTSTF